MAHPLELLVQRATDLFRKQFGPAPSVGVTAPGRVNLIGEHTDYNDGFVMPLALETKVCVVVGSKNDHKLVRIVTESFSSSPYTEFPSNKAGVLSSKEPKWANYVKGVLLQFFEDKDFDGFDIAIATDVPLGGGLSSSASLEVATFTFLEKLTGTTLDKKLKALKCQAAEHWVGVPCGVMDQFISVMGTKGNVLLLDCRTQEETHVPLSDPSVVLLVTNSNVKHELTGGEYSTRRDQCYAAVDAVKKRHPGVKALRDVNQAQLKEIESEVPPVVLARARHVIGEDARTLQAVEALKKGDYEIVGKLMVESHNSLRDDYEVSCAELDILVKLALEVPGVFGSRMTGGGFGGCTVTLLKAEALDNLIQHLHKEYKHKTGIEPTTFPTTAGQGARVLF
eukprot:TRINITY_DN3043_c0_g2_i1.p1 TRINITY_DN3043_c0_g2~~TRINITY_DN3043_c0_g2_i1.p1  ORF type:complete len:395 (-),score=62.29 TRINITY_DN3043_c0_g2_i1:94-1278(-)